MEEGRAGVACGVLGWGWRVAIGDMAAVLRGCGRMQGAWVQEASRLYFWSMTVRTRLLTRKNTDVAVFAVPLKGHATRA